MRKIFKVFLLLISISLLTACKNEQRENKSEVIEENVEQNYNDLSDEEFLIKVGDFVEKDFNGIKWSFKSNGEGIITTDKEYDMKWSLANNKLVVIIDWIHKEKDEYEISFDKDNTSFVLNNEIVFVKSGKIVNNKKYKISNDLIGAWISKSDVGNYMWFFDNAYCNVGYYNDGLFLTNKYYWNVDGDVLELYSITGKKSVYNYVLKDDMFVLYQDGEVKYTFNKFGKEINIME